MPENDYVDININRHGGNAQSNKANKAVAPHKLNWRERILGFVSYRHSHGLGTTLKDAGVEFGKERGQISGRFTELKVAGLIVETGEERDGFMVYRIASSIKSPKS
jgi:hypothetical protein